MEPVLLMASKFEDHIVKKEKTTQAVKTTTQIN
jgi:hypothetical protein